MLKLIRAIMLQKKISDIAHVDVSRFASKSNLANLKSKVDAIDTNNFAVKSEFNSLKTKVDGINLTNYLLKTDFNTEKTKIENKIQMLMTLQQNLNQLSQI